MKLDWFMHDNKLALMAMVKFMAIMMLVSCAIVALGLMGGWLVGHAIWR